MKASALHIPVRVSGVPDGVSAFQIEAASADIGLPEEFHGPVKVDVRMDKTHAHILLEVQAHAELHSPCDRCLEELSIPAEAVFSLLYARDAAASRMAGDEEVRILTHDASFVDIGDDVRDYLLIGVPMRRVCAEYGGNPDCGTSIPVAGEHARGEDARGGIDPRWDGLRSISEQ